MAWWKKARQQGKGCIFHHAVTNIPFVIHILLHEIMQYTSTSALIVLSHNDSGVQALIMGCPMYSNAMYYLPVDYFNGLSHGFTKLAVSPLIMV